MSWMTYLQGLGLKDGCMRGQEFLTVASFRYFLVYDVHEIKNQGEFKYPSFNIELHFIQVDRTTDSGNSVKMRALQKDYYRSTSKCKAKAVSQLSLECYWKDCCLRDLWPTKILNSPIERSKYPSCGLNCQNQSGISSEIAAAARIRDSSSFWVWSHAGNSGPIRHLLMEIAFRLKGGTHFFGLTSNSKDWFSDDMVKLLGGGNESQIRHLPRTNPFKLLVETSNSSKHDKFPIDAGSEPEKELLLTRRLRKCLRCRKDSGSCPPTLLEYKYNVSKAILPHFDKLSTNLFNSPLILFTDRSKARKLQRCLQSMSFKESLIPLYPKFRLTRVLMLNNQRGIDEPKLFCSRLTTRMELKLTTGRERGKVLRSQLGKCNSSREGSLLTACNQLVDAKLRFT
ncbi:hypothetical protein QQP08_007824 [Theobroma cacao]|nr:hypothetical protein QQP08_007824 [Theobroma cacao]